MCSVQQANSLQCGGHEQTLALYRQGVLRSITRTVRLWLRTLELAWLYGPLALTAWLLLLPSESRLTEAWWHWLRHTVEGSGPCAIKLAQWASSRPDLFSDAAAHIFADITDHVCVHTLAYSRRALVDAFGEGVNAHLRLVDDVPIGSGCIAQVHRAQLRADDGGWRDIAVKIRHPRVSDIIETDLDLLALGARALALLPGASLLDPIGVSREFSGVMRSQLDLAIEARNLVALAANFSDERRVRFPAPQWPWVCASVLVEELMIGRPVLESIGSPQAGQIARIGLESVLKMLFLDNLLHADLHAGNILVLEGPDVVLAFVDAGMVKRIAPGSFRTVIGVLGAMVHYDGRLAGELIINHGTAPRPGEDRAAFCDGIGAIVEHARKPEVDFFDHVGEYVAKILSLAYTHHVQLDPDFVAVAIAVRVVEGVAHQLDSKINVAPMCRPYYHRAILEHGLSGLPLFNMLTQHPASSNPPRCCSESALAAAAGA